MSALSKKVREELANYLSDEQVAVMFVENGKLISLEAHDTVPTDGKSDNISQVIEGYPELKKSRHDRRR